MTELVVTVLGRDAPGIIADVTGVLAGLDGNLQDSSMTLLRGHFAMTLVVDVPATAERVEDALGLATGDRGLLVSVRELEPQPAAPGGGASYLLSVHGADRPGIVSALTAVLAARGGNIIDLTTRLSGELYVLVAEVQLARTVDVEELRLALTAVAEGLGVEAQLRPVETEVL